MPAGKFYSRNFELVFSIPIAIGTSLVIINMRLLLVDNYDSFTFNLFHLIDQFDGVELDVFRNDEIDLEDTDLYDKILISPGPGLPVDSGITLPLIQRHFNSKPVLGVCLGMQAIAECGGGSLTNLQKVLHGVSTNASILDVNEKLFEGFPTSFRVGHYHSWCVNRKTLPASFKETAEGDDGLLLSFTHENQLLRGVQFHPESILTDFGKELMSNWLFKCV
jgi:anthranilate synthase component 2